MKAHTYPVSTCISLEFQKRGIRMVPMDGRLLVNAQDTCGAWNLKWAGNKGSLEAVPDRWKMTLVTPDSSGRAQESWFLTVEGVMLLAARSNKEEARAFMEWLMGEVVPAIMQHGFYVHELDTAQQQADWAYCNAREQRKLLRRLTVLQRQPAKGVAYLSLAACCRQHGYEPTSVELLGLHKHLLRAAAEAGMPPIAQPQMKGQPAGLLWPEPVLTQCLTQLPPPQPQLPFSVN